MELSGDVFLKNVPVLQRESVNGTSLKNPFLESFPELNFREASSDFGFLERNGERLANSVARRNVMEAPSTPGRPVFGFSVGNLSRKGNYPSKWDDAEKWLVSGSCSFLDSPANSNRGFLRSMDMDSSRLRHDCKEVVFAEKSKLSKEGATADSSSVLVRDKFTDEVNKTRSPKFAEQGFVFDDSLKSHAAAAPSRDVGTEMTPPEPTSRCPSPLKSSSPARHNTPADRSGPLTAAGITIDLQECHIAKLSLGTPFPSNWSTREEEEEDVSKSLRHFGECRMSVSEGRYCGWEEDEKSKSCLRYQREEARIQAWVNLQRAKAEAESRKLEVKIEKMRSNLEGKLMKRIGGVYRKAEEWRAAAQFQHSEQIRRAGKQAKRVMNRNNLHPNSCGCFP